MAPKPARQAKEDDSEDASGSESDSDAQSEDEPAAAVRPNAAKQKVETLPRPAPAAAKVSPKGVRARLQQAAAGEDESAAQPDFLAAPAISNAEEPAAAAVGGAVKSTRGLKASSSSVRKGITKIPGKEDILAQLEAQRLKQAEQLKVEARARQELEDMLLRIERHFKAEQAARRKAEEQLAQSMQSEASLKTQLEAEVKKRSKEQKQLAAQRDEVKSERAALDQMRAEFENELQQARGEMQRAQDALQGAEDQVSVNQQVERSKMERDYQAQMATLSEELNRVRQELTSRTEVMGQEMERWRQTAEATSRAVTEAKNEVMERKKDLDTTKEKMDKLVEKLYLGREKGVELTGAIEHQLHQHHAMWRRDQGHAQPPQGFPKLAAAPSRHPHHMQATGQGPLMLENAPQGALEAKSTTSKRGPPANVAFGGTLTATRPRVPAGTLGNSQPGSPARARPRQVQPQGNSESFLPAIKAPDSTLRKQQTGVSAQGSKKGGIRSLQHQGSDRWAESKRDAGMVAYTASRWN
ncbi:hypothetical protein WJX79_010574 [Trebouxia sp. C0005]